MRRPRSLVLSSVPAVAPIPLPHGKLQEPCQEPKRVVYPCVPDNRLRRASLGW